MRISKEKDGERKLVEGGRNRDVASEISSSLLHFIFLLFQVSGKTTNRLLLPSRVEIREKVRREIERQESKFSFSRLGFKLFHYFPQNEKSPIKLSLFLLPHLSPLALWLNNASKDYFW